MDLNKKITTMNTLVINATTAIRASVIFQRTENAFMAGSKSQMIESLKGKMSNGVAHFIFQKRNGELREAWGTLSPSLVERHMNGNGESRELYATSAYFDVEVGAWRSFRWESIIRVF